MVVKAQKISLPTDNHQAQQDHLEELKKRLAIAQQKVAVLEGLVEKAEQNCIQEKTTQKHLLEELQMSELIVERSPVILYRRNAHQDNTALVHISRNISQFGYTSKEFLEGKISFKDLIHPDDLERISHEIKGYSEIEADEYTQVYRCITKSGDTHWVEDQTSVVTDEDGNITHYQGVLVDITERKDAEDSLRLSEQKFRRIVETTLEGFLLMDEDLRIIDFNDSFSSMLGYSRQELLGKSPFDLAAEEFKEFLLANKKTILSQESRKIETTVVAKDGRLVPILIHGNTLKDDDGNIIGNMSFITDMTEHKKALTLAAEVQKSLLPQESPDVQGFDVAGRNESCDEIGGDYFDYIWRKGEGGTKFGVVVGDISGHGVESALLMTTARAFLRMRAAGPGTVSDIIRGMNKHLVRDVLDSGRFMTLFYLSIFPETKSIRWVRAGHDPALLYDPTTDSFEDLKGSGVALGLLEDTEYIEHRRPNLKEGQIIALGTDGIWEAFNLQGEMFGKDRLKEIIRSNAHEHSSVILDAIYEEVRIFTTGRKNDDDRTLVIIKVS